MGNHWDRLLTKLVVYHVGLVWGMERKSLLFLEGHASCFLAYFSYLDAEKQS